MRHNDIKPNEEFHKQKDEELTKIKSRTNENDNRRRQTRLWE